MSFVETKEIQFDGNPYMAFVCGEAAALVCCKAKYIDIACGDEVENLLSAGLPNQAGRLKKTNGTALLRVLRAAVSWAAENGIPELFGEPLDDSLLEPYLRLAKHVGGYLKTTSAETLVVIPTNGRMAH